MCIRDSTESVEYKRMSWKDVEHDEKIIETDDQYWKALDRKWRKYSRNCHEKT